MVVVVIVAVAVVVSMGGSSQGGQQAGSPKKSKGTTSTTEATILNMNVHAVAGTEPSVFGITTSIFQGTSKIASFTRSQSIDFGKGTDYTTLQGIVTFRGNNYREGASYGTANVTTGALKVAWTAQTGSVAKGTGKGSWTGSGWTGQPLIVKWPEYLKSIMNISESKKADPDLTEVIYPCLDGNIYFLDLKDGTKTRATIHSGGGPFKGTASIYPNGTPILFVGHGDSSPGKQSVRARLYSLVDQSLLYTFGKQPDPNSLRKFHAYDSSALFDVKTDTIIEPGEDGILYTIKLNTKFDKTAGTLTINPDQPIKWRYTGTGYADGRENTPTTRWWGMEDSAVTWKNFIYVADNGGHLFCVDLNTMKLVWVQDVQDDTNSSPVLEESAQDGTAYIYISTSLHITAKKGKGTVPIWKINAATGEVVWKSTPYDVYTVSGVSGGAQDTPVLGKNDISNLVIYQMARTPKISTGIIVALDKTTGREVWRTSIPNYSWSSPVAVYTPSGKSYIVTCDSIGLMRLLDGKTGTVVSTLNLGSNTEASPAVYGNTIVVGTRGQKIYGITIQ